MILKNKNILNIGIVLVLLALTACSGGIMDPKGVIAYEQKKLIIISLILMLLIVVPVFLMVIIFAIKYRAGNKKAKYTPEWSHSTKLELIWWGIPIVIVAILAYLAYTTSHSLDPKKKIASSAQNITIDVVALPWKWLFIYPEAEIATVNYIEIPVNTPVTFRLTSDHVINSFWIPQLGGQIYAMAGMETHLNLMATESGVFKGGSNNYSGAGYSKMKFDVNVVSTEDYNKWLSEAKTKAGSNVLSLSTYKDVATPTINTPVIYYTVADKGIFDKVIQQFMKPGQPLSKNYEEANSGSHNNRAVSQDVSVAEASSAHAHETSK